MTWDQEKLENAQQLKCLLNDLRIQPRKRWGQNFLLDANIQQNILQAIEGVSMGSVWEIGPGFGALTRHLIACSQRLTIFEIDPIICAYLQLRLNQPQVLEHVQLLPGDIFKTWQEEQRRHGCPDLLVANLPYNIASTLLARFAKQGFVAPVMLLMVQKELADRLTARPSSPLYNALSLCTQLQFNCQALFKVSGSCFYPNTRVTSQLIRLTPNKHSLNELQQQLFFKFTKSIFAQRRKTLHNNLKSGPFNHYRSLFEQQGFSLQQRPEELTLQDYITIIKAASP